MMQITGCGGANTRYAWHNYDAELYEHYKDPAEKEVFIQNLKEIVETAEAEGKVPPGVYAEYGFLLQEKGDLSQAIRYFQKEADKWPESKFLMAKMIANAHPTAQKKSPAVVKPESPVSESATQPAPTNNSKTIEKKSHSDVITIQATPSNQNKNDAVEVLR